jgi:thioester reductase-like protein
VDVIVHNGAWVNGVFDYNELKPHNTDPALAIISLATL